MRAFIAIPLPKEVISDCKDLEHKLKNTGVKMKLVEPENLHITLKFLGNIDENTVNRIKEILDSIKSEPFKAKTSFVGCFPNPDFIRVVWLGVESKEIESIQRDIDKELEKLGFDRERNFVPHITLARVKEKPNKKLKELIGMRVNKEFEVDRILLMKSTLTRGGPIYDVIYEKKL